MSRWYITKHAIEQYMMRINGTSWKHAKDQLMGMAETATHHETKSTGVEVYIVGDLKLLVEDDQRVITVY